MPQAWEDREPPERPRHPPTELAQPLAWSPQRYSQTEHLRRLAPRTLPDPPDREARPAFTPAAPPRYEQRRDFRQASAAGYRGPQRQAPYYPPSARPQWRQPAPSPRRKHRVFLWSFLTVQAIFALWIVVGLASHPAGPSAAAEAAQQCANGGWQVLFKSQADCQVHYAHALNDAGNFGEGIGVALIVVFWMVTDFFLGLGYAVYRLASRR